MAKRERRKPTIIKGQYKPGVVYGRSITHSSYVFDFHTDIWLERGKILTGLFGKQYPLWKKYEDCLQYYNPKCEEILLRDSNVFYWNTNYDDVARIFTFHTWFHIDYRAHFNINVMWQIKKANLIEFRDMILTPLLEKIYNEPPKLKRVAFRFGNYGLHRIRYYHS